MSRERVSKPLTKRQYEVLKFVETYIASHGYPPILDEIREEFGLRSRSTVREHLQKLVARGKISRQPRKARGIIPGTPGTHFLADRTYLRPFLDKKLAFELGKQAAKQAESWEGASRSLEFAEILNLTWARGIVLHLVDEIGEVEPKLKPQIWQGHWREGQEPRSFSLGEGIAGSVWETKRAYVSIGNVRDDEKYLPSGHFRSEGVRSLMAVPMLDVGDRCLGVLSLDSTVVDGFQERLGERVENLENTSNLLLQAVTSKTPLSYKSAVDFFLLGFRGAIPEVGSASSA